MAGSRPEHAFIDTNVLLTATVPARQGHQSALDLINEWPTQAIPLYASGQILREYLVVATRPASVNGLGLSSGDARANVHAFRARLRLLDEHRGVADRLQRLAEEFDVRGKQIHDANVVATMLEHRLDTLVTANPRHFARFDESVDILDLLTLA